MQALSTLSPHKEPQSLVAFSKRGTVSAPLCNPNPRLGLASSLAAHLPSCHYSYHSSGRAEVSASALIWDMCVVGTSIHHSPKF